MYKNIEAKCDYVKVFKDAINAFGGVTRGKEQYVMREKLNYKLNETGNYFGCINLMEEDNGPYSDLSVVVFPSNEDDDAEDRWIVSLVVGSLGFKNDYELASLPGTHRMFVNCLGRESFVKNDFLDIESKDGFEGFCRQTDENGEPLVPPTLKDATDKYAKVILACSLFNPNETEVSIAILKTYLAIYAKLRAWPSNKGQKKAVDSIANIHKGLINEEKEIRELLRLRHFVVLQGAPGTGKTRMAKTIVSGEKNVFFTQFHAETTYSDFVYGIIPKVNTNSLQYQSKLGVFSEAIIRAKDIEALGEKVYLIIDEINRANLANVLGTAFYLFEPSMAGNGIKLEVCPGLLLDKLPDNLYVIATMNTADRSLAVVDFALRRRFAWYTMYPHEIIADIGRVFCKEEFSSVAEIFERYATDEELMLQPGQAYFVVSEANSEKEIKQRLKYEVMPLIKEYFNAGLISRAKDEFVDFFRKEIDVEMYR